MSSATLFERLFAIRATLQQAEAELTRARESMTVTDLGSHRSHLSEDLHTQLGEALVDLRAAIEYVQPMPAHVDQDL